MDVDGLAQLPPLGLHRETKNKGWLAAPANKTHMTSSINHRSLTINKSTYLPQFIALFTNFK